MRILKTKKYNVFKKVTGNREVVKAHVNKLAKVIEEYDLSEAIPVLVNEKMQIIDGQHRVEALKILKKPIYYIIANGATYEKTNQIQNN